MIRAKHFGSAALFAFIATVGMPAEQASAQNRTRIGVYKAWAVFRDPARCYALTAPVVPGGGAFASVANWPRRRVVNQLHLRLYRPARAGSAILLTIDDQLFQLVGRGADAWAPHSQADRAIVAAMRTGVSMTVSARDERGNGFTHAYALNGAATAIDAAALACRRAN